MFIQISMDLYIYTYVGYYRKAVACVALRQFEEAEIALTKGMQLLPDSDKDSADMKTMLEHARFLNRISSSGMNYFHSGLIVE